MNSVSQVLIQIVVLFQITLQHSSKLKSKRVCMLTGKSQILTNNSTT